MADNLIFPIGFDLDKAVKKAAQDWDSKYANQLEKVIQKRAIAVKLQLDNKSIDGLNSAIQRLNKLNLGGNTRGASAELVGFKKQLAELTKEWNKLTAAERGGAAGAALRERYRALQSEANGYVSTLRAAVTQEDKLTAARNRSASATDKGTAATRNANTALQTQHSYLSNLIRKMAAYWSVNQVGNFLSQIRDVTMQFELQRVSLGAIIQDQNRADAMFRQIQGMALESPFKILDLTKYTKQLAAYQIETDDLLDTMKRLADVSAGVGVSMDRLILAYGQVKATGYLRASEVRQFTEAGIPIVDMLAKKLSVANGELVKASEVQDMISKRGIPFEMVADVFEDMTEKGGIFYNMQKKQSETLYGLWQRLGDAASMMFNDIGSNPAVNGFMKTTIQLLRSLMLNWKAVGAAMGPVLAGLAVMKIRTMNAALATRVHTAANKAEVDTLKAKLMSQRANLVGLKLEMLTTSRTNIIRKAAIQSLRLHTRAQIAHTTALIGGATATNIFSKALYRLGAAFMSNPWMLAITVIASIASYFAFATDEAKRLEQSLSEIDNKYATIHSEAATNIKKLADEAVNAADGTKKQKDALDELSRTYGNIIPQELLTIENLRNMKGEYSGLIALVDEYNTKQKYQERKSAIEQSYTDTLKDAEDEAKDWFEDQDLEGTALVNAILNYKDVVNNALDEAYAKGITGEVATQTALAELQDYLKRVYGDDADDVEKLTEDVYDLARALGAMRESLYSNDKAMERELKEINKFNEYVNKAEEIINKQSSNGMALHLMFELDLPNDETIADQIQGLQDGSLEWVIFDTDSLKEYERALDSVKAKVAELQSNKIKAGNLWTPQQEGELQHYLQTQKNISDSIKGLRVSLADLEPFDWSKLSPSEQVVAETDLRLEHLKNVMDAMLEKAGIQAGEWATKVNGRWQANFERLKQLTTNPLLIAAIEKIGGMWGNLAPTDRITQIAHQKVMTIADATGMSTDTIQKCLKNSGENWEEYAKRVKESVEDVLVAKLAALRGEIRDLEEATSGLPQGWIFPANAELAKARHEAEQLEKDLNGVQQTTKWIGTHIPNSDKKFNRGRKSGGKTQDPRLQNLKEEISLTKKLYEEYKNLEKQIGATQAKSEIEKLFPSTIKNLGAKAKKYGFEFQIPFSDEDFKKNLRGFIAQMRKLQGEKNKKGVLKFPTIGKDIEEAMYTLEKIDLDALSKKFEEKLKALANKISRTKTAMEFYDKVLGMTGDIQLSARVTMSIYGQDGADLKDLLLEQIREAFTTNIETGETIDLSSAVDEVTGAIDYNKLAKLEEQYKDVLISERADLRKKLIEEGRKTSAQQAQQWLKDIEKAKDYAQQRIDLAAYTANQIAAINARGDLDQGTKDTLIQGYRDREAKQSEKLEYDEFKDSAMYVQIFEDLDNASTTALKHLRERLVALKGQWQNLDPTQVKELTKAISDLDAQIAGRNPFKTMVGSFKALANARPQKVIDADLIAATAELEKRNNALTAATKRYTDAQTAQLNAEAEVTEARKKLALTLEVSGGKETPEVAAAREELHLKVEGYNVVKEASKDAIASAKAEVDAAREKVNEQQGVVDGLTKEAKTRQENIEDINAANEAIDKYQAQINEALDGVHKMMEAFGASEEDMQFFDDVVGSLNEIVDAGQQAATSVALFMSGNIFGGITSGVSAIGGLVSGFTNLFSAGKVRKANKEIKKQEEILEQLEYTYGRLQKAADKQFGTDYINNYNQQMEVLQAQQAAYLKQAEAERSKGKKADKDKIKEYEEQARETADEITDMENELMAKMTGTDRQSLAREFAESWLDAKVSFESTTDAIASKYKDMIKSMIVEGAAAKIIDSILAPMWEEANKMLKDGDIDGATDIIMDNIDNVVETADSAMNTLYEKLEAKGYDVNKLLGDSDKTGSSATGIKRDYATASEESINGLAAAVNTQNWYIGHVPTIAADVQAMRTFMEQSYTQGLKGVTDLVTIQSQAMTNLQSIDRHTAETVTECQRIAKACEAQVTALNKVIIGKSGASAYSIQVSMR